MAVLSTQRALMVVCCDAPATQPAVWGRGVVREAQEHPEQLGADPLSINSVLAMRLPRCHRHNMRCLHGI